MHLFSSDYREMAVSSSACNTYLPLTFPFYTKYLGGFHTELGLIVPPQPKKHLERIGLHTCTDFPVCPCAAPCLQQTVVFWRALDSPSMGTRQQPKH